MQDIELYMHGLKVSLSSPRMLATGLGERQAKR